MSAELLIGLAAVISAVGQIFEARWGSGRDLRKMVQHLEMRADRVDLTLGLPPLEDRPIGFRQEN